MEITVTPAGGDPVRVVLGPMDGLPSPSVAEVISQQLNLHSAFILQDSDGVRCPIPAVKPGGDYTLVLVRQKTASISSTGSNAGNGTFDSDVPTIVKSAGQDEVDVEYGEPTHLTLARGPDGVGYGFTYEQLQVVKEGTVGGGSPYVTAVLDSGTDTGPDPAAVAGVCAISVHVGGSPEPPSPDGSSSGGGGGGGDDRCEQALSAASSLSVPSSRLSKRLSLGAIFEGVLTEGGGGGAAGYGASSTVRQTFVETVVPGSPADLAGLQPGDQLLMFNGVALEKLTPGIVDSVVVQALDAGPLEVLLRPIDYSKVSSTPKMEGQLVRKLVYQPGGRKMSRRPWRVFHATIRGDVLHFASAAPSNSEAAAAAAAAEDGGGGGSSTSSSKSKERLKLAGCLCEVAHSYTKREHVFRLMMEDGADCLLQAETEAHMEAWVSAIQASAQGTSSFELSRDSGGDVTPGSGGSGPASPARRRSPSRGRSNSGDSVGSTASAASTAALALAAASSSSSSSSSASSLTPNPSASSSSSAMPLAPGSGPRLRHTHRRTPSDEGTPTKGARRKSHRRVSSDGGGRHVDLLHGLPPSPLARGGSGDAAAATAQQQQPMSFRRRLSTKIRQSMRRGSRGTNSGGSINVKDLRGKKALQLSIVDACERFGAAVPPVISRLVEEIERRGVGMEGIYRLTGAHSQVQQLQRLFNTGKDVHTVDLTDEGAWDIHSLCGVVKSYIRNLTEPLLTTAAYPAWVEASKEADEAERARKLRLLARALPGPHLDTLRFLMAHLNSVASAADVNKMKIRNLAIVFGPTIVQPGPDVEPSLGDMAHQCRIVEALLLKHKQLLAPPPGRRTPPPVIVDANANANASDGGAAAAAAAAAVGSVAVVPVVHVTRSAPAKVKVAPAAKRVVIKVAPSAAAAVEGRGGGGSGSGSSGGDVGSSAAGLLHQMPTAPSMTTQASRYTSSNLHGAGAVGAAAASAHNGSNSLAAITATYGHQRSAAGAGAAVMIGNTTSSNHSSNSNRSGDGGGGGGGGGMDADDAAGQFVTDSEGESDDDFVFGANEAISVDVPLEAERWRSRDGSLDPELASPSLSPRTLLSIEQMDSLRVERGLKGLHNPVASAASTQRYGSPSSSSHGGGGSLPNSLASSRDVSRRSSKELLQPHVEVISPSNHASSSSSVGVGTRTSAAAAAAAAAAAYTAYDDADDDEYDEDEHSASFDDGPRKGRFLMRRDSDNETGTFL